MTEQATPQAVWQALAAHPRVDSLAQLVFAAAMAAADERRSRLSDGLSELMADSQLSFEDGETDWGNVLRSIEGGDDLDAAMRLVLASLLARAVATQPLDDEATTVRIAERLAWLAANTNADALALLDLAVADLAPSGGVDPLWMALGDVVRNGQARQQDRPSGLAALAAVLASSSAGAQLACEGLSSDLRDPLMAGILKVGAARASSSPPQHAIAPRDDTSSARPVEATLQGELVSPPMRVVTIVLTAVTGLLLLRYLWRLIARWLLRMRRPAQLRIAPSGVTLASSLAVMGRTVRSQETHIPIDNLARAVREVRYPRLAMYLGLIALAVGSYLGVTFMLYGTRAGSPSLLGLGAAVFGIGVLCDFVFSVVLPGKRGKYRLVFVPRKGAKLAFATQDTAAAGAALRSLAP